MHFEESNPIHERPENLERSLERERKLLGRFSGRSSRWLASAMLLLTTEGCGAGISRSANAPKTEAETCFNMSSEHGQETVCVPKSQADDFRRANRLPVEPNPEEQPSLGDYLTEPDEQGRKRPLFGVNREDLDISLSDYQRRKTAPSSRELDEAMRKFGSRPSGSGIKPNPIKPPDTTSDH